MALGTARETANGHPLQGKPAPGPRPRAACPCVCQTSAIRTPAASMQSQHQALRSVRARRAPRAPKQMRAHTHDASLYFVAPSPPCLPGPGWNVRTRMLCRKVCCNYNPSAMHRNNHGTLSHHYRAHFKRTAPSRRHAHNHLPQERALTLSQPRGCRLANAHRDRTPHTVSAIGKYGIPFSAWLPPDDEHHAHIHDECKRTGPPDIR